MPGVIDAQTDVEAQTAELRILLVDDDEAGRFLIRGFLKRTRSVIEVAENGAAAVEMFKHGQYDLVLMDVEMPVMDGFLATQEIRRFEREAGIEATPIVALTAHSAAEVGRHIDSGFTGIVTKPIRIAELLEVVARHAAGDPGNTQAAANGHPPASTKT